jgi:hypothetical protein
MMSFGLQTQNKTTSCLGCLPFLIGHYNSFFCPAYKGHNGTSMPPILSLNRKFDIGNNIVKPLPTSIVELGNVVTTQNRSF